MSGWHERRGADLVVSVRLTPRSSREGIEGVAMLADGSAVLAVKVRAVPEEGAANAALEAMVAARLGVAKSAVAVVSGHRQRLKKVRATNCAALSDAEIEARLTGKPT